jgi:site-specific DNA recombinase
MRAVIYARYSSDKQREASIEDQVEVCRRYAAAQGWTVVGTYMDAALSGASRFRPEFQRLLGDAGKKQFEVVICEAVDRLGRRLADTADLQDRLAFHGVRLFTPSLGEVTPIHVAVMGMMAQMALKDLGEKTRRGQLGRVLKGKVAGGLAYGYRVAQDEDGGGGAREIDPDEAKTVERIFREFGAGKSPEAIAKDLNREGAQGPGGRAWSNTTIRGQAERGTGILNNGLYHGVLEWNRCSYVKDPRTGKRVARPNPPEQWEVQPVPELRIVSEELWQKAKERQAAVRPTRVAEEAGSASGAALNESHRSRFLLSGLLSCGCCGGGYTVIGKDRYGCATRRQKGTCDNARTITRQQIESRVLEGLKERLLAPDLVAEFIREFQEVVGREREERKAQVRQREKKRAEVERKIAGLMKAIEDGLYEPSMKDRMKALQAEREALAAEPDTASTHDLDVLMHPRLPELYRRKVAELERVLEGPDRAEAMDLIRSMIDRVDITPRADGGGVDAVLHGDLAAILAACGEAGDKRKLPGAVERPGSQLSVVAGTGFEPVTFRL